MTSPADQCVVLASFAGERDPDGEAVRISVALDPDLRRWRTLPGVLRSAVGTGGIRDPFLLHDPAREQFVLLGTDLRVWPDQDWSGAVTAGSRSVVVSESADLLTWSTPRTVEIAPPDAGNAWAPKAFPADGGGWHVFFAAALYGSGERTPTGSYQRVLVTRTDDFTTFSPATTYLDPGYDVIDLTFVATEAGVLRFSVRHPDRRRPTFVTVEAGSRVDSADFRLLTADLGRGPLARAEGPAPLARGGSVAVLLDEFGGRGYRLFTAEGPAFDAWAAVPDARPPAGARHGSLLAVPEAHAATLHASAARVRVR